MKMLESSGLTETIVEEAGRKPLLGICLGMQMLFDYGYEFEKVRGLSLIPGEVSRIVAPGLKIPHMGWSDIRIENECALSAGIKGRRSVLFRSFLQGGDERNSMFRCTASTETIFRVWFSGTTFMGLSSTRKKSGGIGLKLLRNFGELK